MGLMLRNWDFILIHLTLPTRRATSDQSSEFSVLSELALCQVVLMPQSVGWLLAATSRGTKLVKQRPIGSHLRCHLDVSGVETVQFFLLPLVPRHLFSIQPPPPPPLKGG